MGIVIAIVVLALLFGVMGAVFTAVKWLLYIGIALLVVGAIMGFLRRSTARR